MSTITYIQNDAILSHSLNGLNKFRVEMNGCTWSCQFESLSLNIILGGGVEKVITLNAKLLQEIYYKTYTYAGIKYIWFEPPQECDKELAIVYFHILVADCNNNTVRYDISLVNEALTLVEGLNAKLIRMEEEQNNIQDQLKNMEKERDLYAQINTGLLVGAALFSVFYFWQSNSQ